MASPNFRTGFRTMAAAGKNCQVIFHFWSTPTPDKFEWNIISHLYLLFLAPRSRGSWLGMGERLGFQVECPPTNSNTFAWQVSLPSSFHRTLLGDCQTTEVTLPLTYICTEEKPGDTHLWNNRPIFTYTDINLCKTLTTKGMELLLAEQHLRTFRK